MIRLLHVADIHQGLLRHSRPDPATGLPSALLSAARCWRRACEIAVERAVDVVVVAGDVFHDRHPRKDALTLFDRGLRTLQGADIPVIMIPGNHDGAEHPSQQSVLEVFHDPPQIQVVTRPGIVEAEGIRFACLPWTSREQLMAGSPDLSRAEADMALQDALVRTIGALRAGWVKGAPPADILVGHWSVEGSVISVGGRRTGGGGSERDVAMLVGEPVIPLPELDGFQWVAMGHIHKEQGIRLPAPDPVESRLIGAYPGSVDRVDFGEEHERKVALEVQLDTSGVLPDIPTAHELPARRFLSIPLDDFEDAWREPDRHGIPGAIVRVQATLDEEQADRIDGPMIERRLREAGAHLAYWRPKVERRTVPRAPAVAQAESPHGALEAYLRAKDVPEGDREFLMDLFAQVTKEPIPG